MQASSLSQRRAGGSLVHHQTADSARHHAIGYESGEALLDGLQRNLSNLALLDVRMLGLSGLDC